MPPPALQHIGHHPWPDTPILAIEQAISCYLQNELLPAADELLRRVQAAALVLRDLERAGISLAAADRARDPRRVAKRRRARPRKV